MKDNIYVTGNEILQGQARHLLSLLDAVSLRQLGNGVKRVTQA